MPRKTGIHERGKSQGVTLTKEAAKQKVLEQISLGKTVQAALDMVGRKSYKTYELWRKEDPDWRDRVDIARATVKTSGGDREERRQTARAMGFEAFREKYLGVETAPHQQQWIDVIEGREPRNLHESQTWQPSNPRRVVVNCPPNHGKSVTISMDYVAYRICCNPNVRIKIISRTQELAKQFLYGVKHRLSNHNYKDLQMDFAPEGGFGPAADSWTTDQIYLGGDRDTSEKDPTVQALGVGGQIYGSRANLIICDDIADLAHAGDWPKMLQWLKQEVSSRPGPSGMILVIGTRVAPTDVYSELLNPDNYQRGNTPWSYLSQPAILREAGEPEEWETLWPKSHMSWWNDEDGACGCGDPACRDGYPHEDGERPWFPRWDGRHISQLMETYDARSWALIFQQSAIQEDATFPAYAVNYTINGARRAGTMNSRYEGDISGLYYIGGLDPATTGQAGAIVYAVDRKTGKRYVVDARVLKGPSPRTLKNLMKEWSTTYPIKLWSVDKTGLNTYFVQDDELRQWLTSHGIILYPHYISGNKWDPTYGIGSLAPLFGSWKMSDQKPELVSEPLVSLPRADSAGMKALVQQLQVWSPEADPKKTPQDMVMALWFAEVQARKIVKKSTANSHYQRSSYISRSDQQRRGVINLSEYRRVS